jgi:hypothetical protein
VNRHKASAIAKLGEDIAETMAVGTAAMYTGQIEAVESTLHAAYNLTCFCHTPSAERHRVLCYSAR